MLIKRYFLLVTCIGVFSLTILQSILDPSLGEIVNFVSLFIAVFFVAFYAHAYLMKVKFKYDGDTFLSLTGYSRRQLVIANYLFTLVSFLFAIGVAVLEFWILHATSGTEMLSFWIVSVTFFIVSLMISILIPLEYQFGLMNSQLIAGIIIFLTPLLLMIAMKLPGSTAFLMHLSSPLISLFLLIAGLAFAVCSIHISISIFQKKDL